MMHVTFSLQGRDLESALVNHKYTKQEQDLLATYESLDYLPSHSDVYKHWLKRQPKRYLPLFVAFSCCLN